MAVRYRSTTDRRVVHVRLTAQGRDALVGSPSLFGDGFMSAFGRLPHPERVAMAQAVEGLSGMMQPQLTSILVASAINKGDETIDADRPSQG